MKKASILLGLGLLGTALISFTATHKGGNSENAETSTILSESYNPFAKELKCEPEAENLKIEDIAFLEKEEEIDLGFDTTEYLPLGFNAYKGMDFDLDDIVYLEEDDIDLNFDVEDYLPENFEASGK